MSRTRARAGAQERAWRIPGLAAAGPSEGNRRELALFGQFVGSWIITERRAPPSRLREPGEVHFNWILDGRAIQDVWGSLDPRTRRLIPWGTTVRYYDPQLEAWRSTWISPRQHVVRRFIGRPVRGTIVLEEEDRGSRSERWVFSDIERDSFTWSAWKRPRPGARWRKIEIMRAYRMTGSSTAKRPRWSARSR